MVSQRPGVGLGVMIYNDDRLLFGLRDGAHGSESFQFPGGHLEWDEDFVGCALRETREESGLVIRVNPTPVAVTNDFFRSDNKHYVTIFMVADYVSGIPKVLEPKKCKGWNWYSKDSMPDRDKLFLPIQNLLSQGYELFGKRSTF